MVFSGLVDSELASVYLSSFYLCVHFQLAIYIYTRSIDLFSFAIFETHVQGVADEARRFIYSVLYIIFTFYKHVSCLYSLIQFTSLHSHPHKSYPNVVFIVIGIVSSVEGHVRSFMHSVFYIHL